MSEPAQSGRGVAEYWARRFLNGAPKGEFTEAQLIDLLVIIYDLGFKSGNVRGLSFQSIPPLAPRPRPPPRKPRKGGA